MHFVATHTYNMYMFQPNSGHPHQLMIHEEDMEM